MPLQEKALTLQSQNGTMAEGLGSGLQNRVQQFESAWYLENIEEKERNAGVSFSFTSTSEKPKIGAPRRVSRINTQPTWISRIYADVRSAAKSAHD